jgi:periplasmic protein TonB
MENKKSLLIVLILIISAHLLLFANLKMDEIKVVTQNKSTVNISKINLKNVIVKKPKQKVETPVEPIVKKTIEKPLPKTKSKNIIKHHDKKKVKEHKEKKKIYKKPTELIEKTEPIKQEVQQVNSPKETKKANLIDPSELKELENEYLSKLRYLIEKNKIYPKSAKRLNQMGKVLITFQISKNGQIKNIRIVKDSSFQRLNDAAIEILTKLNTFEPIPEKLNKNSWEITVPIVYQIKRS